MVKNKKFILGCVCAALASFGSSFFIASSIQHQQNDVQTDEPSDEAYASQSLSEILAEDKAKPDRKAMRQDFYMPQYKDNNGICGIAVNDKGEHVAVKSDGACPTNETLSVNYGYEYELLTDSYRPKGLGNSCGTAHFVSDGARIGSKDMAKLASMANGNLDSVTVEPRGVLCPTQAELSDSISNSVGVPVRFEYNDFNVNQKNYPVFNVTTSDYQKDIDAADESDMPILYELSGSKVKSANGVFIPKILLTPEAKSMCDGDFGKCDFYSDEMRLVNAEKKLTYHTRTKNGYVLPLFMMTKGAWDTCGGIFSQCIYTPDAEDPNHRGTLTNIVTHKSYTSKVVGEILTDEEMDAAQDAVAAPENTSSEN